LLPQFHGSGFEPPHALRVFLFHGSNLLLGEV
jgi:hypothetical protein